LIDADDDFRTALAANLRDDGHQVVEARRADDLPATPQLDGVGVVIVGDYDGPSLRFCDRVHRLHPDTSIILITQYRTDRLERDVASRTFLTVLCKPLAYDDLHALIITHPGH
jgi:DNA-binding NtrC family response regulator